MRSTFTLLHRWLGLAIAVFLVLAGLTGCILAFYNELDVWTNPSLYRVSPPAKHAQALDPFQLREQVLQQVSGISITYIDLAPALNQAIIIYVNPDTANADAEIENDQFFVNPYTGQILGARLWGDITQGWRNVMPFLFLFHETLALGTVGSYLFGIVALLWTLDCFVGLYLTFPIRAVRQKKAWLMRWKPAWTIRWQASAYKLNFDLHRAGGLWVWAMLLVFAWSGVAFNLNDEVYNPVMSTMFDMQTKADAIPNLAQPLHNPPISFKQAATIGQRLSQEQAQQQNFKAGSASSIYYNADKGVYFYKFSSNADIRDHGSSRILLSAKDGNYLGIVLPNREATGWQITDWIEGLHRAQIGGLAIQVFVSLTGAVVTMLSVTGIIIWWRKRKSRNHIGARSAV